MKKIKVRYNGVNYFFDVYSTTINQANIFFVQAQEGLKKWLVEDQFFIVAAPSPVQPYFLNLIQNTKEEKEFKTKIADQIVADFFAEGHIKSLSEQN